MYSEIFRNRLKEYRTDKNWTQAEVARKLGIAPTSYANWEQGRTQPSLDEFQYIVKMNTFELGLPVIYVILSLPKIEIDNVYGVDFLDSTVFLSLMNILGDCLGCAI